MIIPLPWVKPPITGNRTRGNPYARAAEVKNAHEVAAWAIAERKPTPASPPRPQGASMSAQRGRQSGLPSNAELAARLRGGETLEALSDQYGVSPRGIVVRLRGAGWGSDGQPNTEQPKPSKPVALIPNDSRAWLSEALCAKAGNGDGFFAADEDESLDTGIEYLNTRSAKDTCGRCPVRAKCLDWAMENDERHGIWGGLTYFERCQLAGRKPVGRIDITKEMEIRDWARERGLPVGVRGGISSRVLNAYEADQREAAS